MFISHKILQTVNSLPTMQGMQETWVDPWVRKMPWRKEWQPTPVFLPEESHGQRILVGYSPWDHKESRPHGRVLEWVAIAFSMYVLTSPKFLKL